GGPAGHAALPRRPARGGPGGPRRALGARRAALPGRPAQPGPGGLRPPAAAGACRHRPRPRPRPAPPRVTVGAVTALARRAQLAGHLGEQGAGLGLGRVVVKDREQLAAGLVVALLFLEQAGQRQPPLGTPRLLAQGGVVGGGRLARLPEREMDRRLE